MSCKEHVKLSHYQRNGDGLWHHCYVRGIGVTDETAKLHAESLVANKRLEIALREDYRTPACPFSIDDPMKGYME